MTTLLIDSSNSTVTSTVTWGDGASNITLTVNGRVQSGGVLTLDIPDLNSFKGDGYYVEVDSGGIIVLGNETMIVPEGKQYKLLGRV